MGKDVAERERSDSGREPKFYFHGVDCNVDCVGLLLERDILRVWLGLMVLMEVFSIIEFHKGT